MAITEILATASTAASSSDQAVASGAIVTLLVKGSGSVAVEMKNADGNYRPIGTLTATSDARSGGQITGPITFRVTRSVGQSVGCDKDDGT